MTLAEAAGESGVKSYGAVGRACRGIQLKREVDRRFRRRLENLEDVICQQNGLLPKRRLNSAIDPTEPQPLRVLAVHDQSTARSSALSLSSNPESVPADDHATVTVSVRIDFLHA